MKPLELFARTKRTHAVRFAHIIGFAGAMLMSTVAHSAASESTEAPSSDRSGTVPLYADLGTYHKGISTRIQAAQQYFDQGLRFVYGFNHAEAIRSFSHAAEIDPTCAMCYWGIAL